MCVEHSHTQRERRIERERAEHKQHRAHSGEKALLSTDKSECENHNVKCEWNNSGERKMSLFHIQPPMSLNFMLGFPQHSISPCNGTFQLHCCFASRFASLTSICFVCSPSTPHHPASRPLALSTWTDEIHFINTPKMFSDMLFSRSFVRHASFLSFFLPFRCFVIYFRVNKQKAKAKPNKLHIDTYRTLYVLFISSLLPSAAALKICHSVSQAKTERHPI